MTQLRGASINPDDFVQGGLLDDFDGRITKARWVEYDYNGKSKPVLALNISFLYEGGEHDDYYACGDLSRLQPNKSTEGKTLSPADGHIIKGTKASDFINSLIGIGFPKNLLVDDISVIENTEAHFLRKADKERVGLKNAQPVDPEKGPKTTLLCKTLISLPNEKNKLTFGAGVNTGTRSVGAPSSQAASAAASSNGGDLEAKTEQVVLTLLATNNNRLTKQQLIQSILKGCQEAGYSDVQGQIASKAYSNDWVKAASRPWKSEADGTLVLQ